MLFRRDMKIIFLILFGCRFVPVASIYAQEPRPSDFREEKERSFHARMKMEMDQFMEEIGVTEEQKEKLEMHRQQHMESFRAVRKQMHAKEKELRDILKENDVDRIRLEKVKEELLELKSQDIDQKIEGTLWMKKVLTAEQMEKLGQKMEAHRKGKNSFREKGQRRLGKESFEEFPEAQDFVSEE